MRKRSKPAVKAKKRWILSKVMKNRLAEGFFLFIVACSVFLFISLLSYHASDPGWSTSKGEQPIHNSGGWIGAWLADVFLSFFGMVAYLFPFLLVLSSWLGLEEKKEEAISRDWLLRLFGWGLFFVSFCGLMTLYFKSTNSSWPAGVGGVVGDITSRFLSHLLNQPGSTIFLVTTLFAGITLLTGFSWLSFIDRLGEYCYDALKGIAQKAKKTWIEKRKEWLAKKAVQKETIVLPVKPMPPVIEIAPIAIETPKRVIDVAPLKVAPIVQAVTKPISKPSDKRLTADHVLAPNQLPPLSLLQDSIQKAERPFTSYSFEALSSLVETRLNDFGVEAKVMGIYPGPIITRFELDLAPGIKVSKIVGLAKDIARSLSTVSVRVVEVIPGKSYIGLEIPNEHRDIVTLKEVLSSSQYKDAPSFLSMALGKDIAGMPVVVDLAKMPHLLVAGTTGSGKSVSLNTMLLSLLYKATPKDVRLILIDPKMLELSVYEGIPHLLTPVITDMKDAANALRWCVAEMDKRYRLMASLGVRNLAGYNEKIQQAHKENDPLYMPTSLVKTEEDAKTLLTQLPLIVVIIDELADMMMVVGKKVEDLITRIAQKARAAGIHLVLATQRPSVDVITGLIKANIPTRIAFQVSSRIDSRTILDQQGAEQLLGHGDMLYLPPGAGVPMRVHGAYVADEEVHRVVACWRTGGEPEYLQDVTQDNEESSGGAEGMGDSDSDPLYADAVKIVLEARRASISLVQRRLRIGYNRAARLMEQMEASGIVSVMDHSGNREILMSTDS